MLRATAYPRTRTTEITRVTERVVGVSNVIVDAFHHLEVYLELDVADPFHIVICHAEGRMKRVPYSICYQPLSRMAQLVGMQVERGLYQRVKEAVGGPQGCVHLVDLTMDGIRLAMQAIAVVWTEGLPEEEAAERQRLLLGGVCIAYPAKK